MGNTSLTLCFHLDLNAARYAATMAPFEDLMMMVAAASGQFAQLLLSPASHFSIWSLGSAFGLALAFLVMRRRRPVRFRVAVRALFPKHLRTGASATADMRFLILNGAIGPLLFGAAILSHQAIAAATQHGLDVALGAHAPVAASQVMLGIAMSIVLFLAYEFGYWLDHWLSHHIPALWTFHKVHHSAETLTPITNFRVHPVDTIVFYNIVALTTGVASGVMGWALGNAVAPLTIGSVNVLTIGFVFLLLHLQHSQLWIAFPGKWGRLILSPAHHQLHHSSNPAHFNSNYGNGLAIFDHVFGTLRLPRAANERLSFGTPDLDHDPHTLTGALLRPFVDVIRSTRR
jgi:sterol desaturase/sphingolipid hydroxylase (fatty acid hydroxylase superfamily)